MLILYIRPGCPYCAKVLRTGQELGIAFDLKTIENPEIAAELKEAGAEVEVK